MTTSADTAREPIDMKALVSRFLGWPLPQSVAADGCATNNAYQFPRSGTNLLNADEAEAMLRYVLEGISTAPTTGSAPVAVAFRWRRRQKDKWEYETHATLVDADTVRVMLSDGWEVEWLQVAGNCVAAPPANAPAASVLTDEQIAELWQAQIKINPTWEGLIPAFARSVIAASMGGDRT